MWLWNRVVWFVGIQWTELYIFSTDYILWTFSLINADEAWSASDYHTIVCYASISICRRILTRLRTFGHSMNIYQEPTLLNSIGNSQNPNKQNMPNVVTWFWSMLGNHIQGNNKNTFQNIFPGSLLWYFWSHSSNFHRHSHIAYAYNAQQLWREKKSHRMRTVNKNDGKKTSDKREKKNITKKITNDRSIFLRW